MKLFRFLKPREITGEEDLKPVELNSGQHVFDEIQQEFIAKATANAERIVRVFNGKYNGAFDYSIRSLSVLDALIEDFAAFAALSDEEIIDDFCAQAGSYILEVARRHFGGVYFWEDELEQPMLKTGLPGFEITLLTFGKVKKRIVHGEPDNVPYFFKGYAERVRRAEPGDRATFA